MSRAVYLCGFMGCGKTTVGRVLADLLGTAYADMDAYIEKSEKMSIPQILSDKGEGYFRDAETRAVEKMGKNGGVIACGGGAMLREKNAELAAKNGVVVYIDTPYDICWERIKDDANRPIVAVNTKGSLGELYEKAEGSLHRTLGVQGRRNRVAVTNCGADRRIYKKSEHYPLKADKI